MTGATLFSGILAPETALPEAEWQWCAEIEPFCCSLIAERHPELENLGDVTAKDFLKRARSHGALDLLVGGSPCQSFSVAGLRNSLEDSRGNLTLRLVEIVHAIKPRYLLWENVPGVLSTQDNAFGCFLAGLVGADEALAMPEGQGWSNAGVADGPRGAACWRVLDAQYFGLAQRRKRVFLVFRPGASGVHPAEILFEWESLRRDSPPGRETWKGPTHPLAESLTGSGRGVERAGSSRGQDPVVACAEVSSTLNTDWAHRSPESHAQEFDSEKGARFIAYGGSGTDERHEHSPDLDRDAGGMDHHERTPGVSGVLRGMGEAQAYGRNHTSGALEQTGALSAKGGAGRMDFETETVVAQAFEPHHDEHEGRGANFKATDAHPALRGPHGCDNTVVAHTLRSEHDASEDGTGRGIPLIAHALSTECSGVTEDGTGRGSPLVPWLPHGYRVQDPESVADTMGANMTGGTRINPVLTEARSWTVSEEANGYAWESDVAPTIQAMANKDSTPNAGGQIAVAFHQNQRAEVTLNDTAGALNSGGGKPGQGYPAVALYLRGDGELKTGDISCNLSSNASSRIGTGHPMVATAFAERGRSQGRTFESQQDLGYALTNPGTGGRTHSRQLSQGMGVRRLTPTECERLQGFPDDYTLVTHRGSPAADGPRYKALGNSMAVPVLRWIGLRILHALET